MSNIEDIVLSLIFKSSPGYWDINWVVMKG
jgi:hypothetical protein